MPPIRRKAKYIKENSVAMVIQMPYHFNPVSGTFMLYIYTIVFGWVENFLGFVEMELMTTQETGLCLE